MIIGLATRWVIHFSEYTRFGDRSEQQRGRQRSIKRPGETWPKKVNNSPEKKTSILTLKRHFMPNGHCLSRCHYDKRLVRPVSMGRKRESVTTRILKLKGIWYFSSTCNRVIFDNISVLMTLKWPLALSIISTGDPLNSPYFCQVLYHFELKLGVLDMFK